MILLLFGLATLPLLINFVCWTQCPLNEQAILWDCPYPLKGGSFSYILKGLWVSNDLSLLMSHLRCAESPLRFDLPVSPFRVAESSFRSISPSPLLPFSQSLSANLAMASSESAIAFSSSTMTSLESTITSSRSAMTSSRSSMISSESAMTSSGFTFVRRNGTYIQFFTET
jgi:hypothetical protein